MKRDKTPATRVPNEERGEIALILEGESLGMRPSYEAIHEFEAATGKGLLDLSRQALSGSLSLGETAQIAACCIRAWGRAVDNPNKHANAKAVGQLIMAAEGGYHDVLNTIAGMLALAVTGKYTASGEVKPVTGKTSGAPFAG